MKGEVRQFHLTSAASPAHVRFLCCCTDAPYSQKESEEMTLRLMRLRFSTEAVHDGNRGSKIKPKTSS
ncbi:hypothetical protein E2C01_049539 [Portunus trituberculatus]|uniref:Uncharacterized protein n=1 Tax=Portunus trituberculatus TaxID=210409 RepID=A0A5B7GE55_PORTR|nr:hypothetical protein [Portunus trituberculatus]